MRSAWVTWMQSSRVGVEHDCLDLVVIRVEVLEHRDAEGQSLAGPGLRLADHVMAGEQRRDALRLDRARIFEAEFVDCLLYFRGEPEVLEGNAVFSH